MPEHVDCLIHLRTEAVSVIIDGSAGRLPGIAYWGADLGELTPADVTAVIAGGARAGALADQGVPTGAALLPELWTTWTGRPGLSGSRNGRDWSPKFTTTGITVDGDVTEHGSVIIGGAASVQFRAADPAAGLELVITVELITGGLLRSRAEVINTGAEPYQLDDLVLAYPVPERAREILDFAGRWAKERTPQRRELTVGTHLREGRRGRTGADAATVLQVGTPGFGFADGEIWGVHVAWSGNHTHYAERIATGEQVVGGGELLLPGELRLSGSESYASPWLYGSYGVGLDQVARRFHRYLRSRDQHPDRDRPVTLNVWEAVYFDHDTDRLIDLAERAAALGVERYVLDDGWFGARRNDHAGLGDWTVSPDVWPEGLHPLVNRVRELGMEFGLWFEPEMINLDSDVARAHPEWVMATGDRLPVEHRQQQVINLGIPECYAYLRDAIGALLDEYPIGYIKWDHNRDLIDSGTAPDGRPGVHAQTAAVYRLIDELKAAHPGLEIESCSSGGARVDLGILERTDRVWVSDCIDPLERQQMNRWTTQLIPPELMGSHVASGRSHTTSRRHDLSFRAGTAVFGHFGIEWDLAEATEAELAELGGWIDFFKAERGLLLGGDLVRIDYPDESIHAHGVVAPDRRTAIFAVAAVGRSEVESVGRIPLRGLDPDLRYRVEPVMVDPAAVGRARDPWFTPTPAPLPGSVLIGGGLRVSDLRPEHVVLVRVEAVEAS
ncbi:alpha-galactosidase [Microlunatus sp. GCM10028923]|uniref:alpha-galactosidase n=1 Tax=Microlunatus sp. GCM10028923 TaxID=3273400 RepID=UPI0036188E0A